MVYSFSSYSISSYYGLGHLFESWLGCFSVWGSLAIACHEQLHPGQMVQLCCRCLFSIRLGWTSDWTCSHNKGWEAERKHGCTSAFACIPNVDIPSVKTHHVAERYSQLLMGGPQKSHCEGHGYTEDKDLSYWCKCCCYCSVAQLCPTLCHPVDCSMPGLPVPHHLPEFAQVHVIASVMPSNHLILWYPLLLLPSVFPSIRNFSSESAIRIRWLKYWSFSFSISPITSHKLQGIYWSLRPCK